MSVSFFGQLCRSVRGSTVLLLILGALLLALALVAGIFTLLVWDKPDSGIASQVLVLLDSQLTETQINGIYLELRRWEEVRSLLFALDAHDFDLPSPNLVPSKTPAVLLRLNPGIDPQQVVEAAQLIDGSQRAISLAANDTPTVFSQAQTLRPILLTAFVVLLLSSFFALIGGVRRLVAQWRGELELLRLSGVARKNTLSSFAAMGMLAAGIGSALAAIVVYIGTIWGQRFAYPLVQNLPFALDPERMVGLALGALIVGLFVGVIAGAWGIRSKHSA